MALNEIQKQEAQRLFTEGKSVQDVYRHFGAKASGTESPLDIQERALGTKSTTPSRMKQMGSYIGSAVVDAPQDVFTGFKQLGEGYLERHARLKESGRALTNKEQSIGETGMQFGANIAGGLFADTSYQLLRTAGSFATTPEQETKIGEFIGEKVTQIDEEAGISDWYNSLSPRAQRNVSAGLDLLDVAPVPLVDKIKGAFNKPKTELLPSPATTQELQTVVRDAYNGESVSGAAKVVNNTVDDAAREKLVTDLSQAYNDSIVGDLKTYNRKLQEQAQDMSRGGNTVTQDDLVRALAEEGIVPDVRGKLADFTTEVRRIDERQNKLFEQYRPILEGSKASADVEDFRTFAKQSLIGRRSMAAELDAAEARLDKAIDNISRSLGVDDAGKLTAAQIDEMSRIANDRTSAYRDSDVFQADVFSELGRASRLWLEENVPDKAFREVNDEWMRLNNVKTTAQNLQNAQIDVGLLGRAIGSYVTTVGATALAAPTGNPAIALLAGMLTKMGGDEVANWMRSQKFSPEVRDVLQRQVLDRDAQLLENLKQSATDQANKNFFEEAQRALPPARPDAPRSEVASGAAIAAPGQTPRGRVEPGITERTKEGTVNRQETEAKPTELEQAIKDDTDAVSQAVAEMEADMTGETRVSTGDNLVQSSDGGYYRFNELPSWVPEGMRDSDLMARVMNNITTGKKPRSNAGREAELQEVVEARIQARAEEIKKGKGDSGVFSKDAAFAVALMVGGTYFLSDEDGMLPVVAIGSMMANPTARSAVLKNAKKMAESGKKLPEPYKRKIAESLEDYDAGFTDVKQNGVTKSIVPDSVDERIAELQERNYSGNLTNKDLLEAEELLANKGVILDPDSFNQSATTQTNLLEEAKKYDSATKLYHGSDIDIKNINFDSVKGDNNPAAGLGFFTTPKKQLAGEFGKAQEFTLKPNAKVLRITDEVKTTDESARVLWAKVSDEIAGGKGAYAKLPVEQRKSIMKDVFGEYVDINKGTPYENTLNRQKAIRKWLVSNGYDAVEMPTVFKDGVDTSLIVLRQEALQ